MAGGDVLDIHTESFVWSRVFGYDVARAHGRGLLGARLYSQADLPRMVAGGLTGAVLSIATNPFRRQPVLAANVGRLVHMVSAPTSEAVPAVPAGAVPAEVVTDVGGYRRARAAGRFACFVGVQGANAVHSAAELPAEVTRVTLVHLTRSPLGSPSAPLGGRGGLTARGREMVQGLNYRRVLVDLAHANRPTFWDALAVHDRSLPPIVSHTGVSGVYPCWRNIDDDQVRAVADRGGVVGIMYHCGFGGRGFLGGPTTAAVLDHLEHVIAVGGEGAAALGSDWDGLIVPPTDMPTAADLPVLVAAMVARRWPERRALAVLGGNYLRVMEDVRPTPAS
ncbi:MAG: membrane dipeptidase [Actinomycetota bacterium]